MESPGTALSGTSLSFHGTSALHRIRTQLPPLKPVPSFQLPNATPLTANESNKRKRRPAGTPDPDAEVIALSPRTLMESDRYVCEICNQGFQRDQNLQMHRRRHKVPWKLLKKHPPQQHNSNNNKKRVYVCPDPTCLHNDPGHALGDLVGIKKHFRRKHSGEKQWKCERCSKAYAVHSDFKAHLKTCGTRGHSCDCGRVFSRVESFIEHQDNCGIAKERAILECGDPKGLFSPLTVRSNGSNESRSSCISATDTLLPSKHSESRSSQQHLQPSRTPTTELQFFTSHSHISTNPKQNHLLQLQESDCCDLSLNLSIGPAWRTPTCHKKISQNEVLQLKESKQRQSQPQSYIKLWGSLMPTVSVDHSSTDTEMIKPTSSMSDGRCNSDMSERSGIEIDKAKEDTTLEWKATDLAERTREMARWQIQLAETELAAAKRIEEEARMEVARAQFLRRTANCRRIDECRVETTCHACLQQFLSHFPRQSPQPSIDCNSTPTVID